MNWNLACEYEKLATTSRLRKIVEWLPFFGILTLYALLIIPTINRLGIGWDEEVDLRIARAYLTTRGFFLGTPLDSSQTRLPMFTVALLFRLFESSDLLLARWTSVIVGGLTLLGIYIYGKERLSREAGLLAAGLLAINPFFLAFSRLAFTESDIYLACTLTWLLVILGRLQERATLGLTAVTGLFLGLAISSKATVLVILPAIWVTLYSLRFPALNSSQMNANIPSAKPISARVVRFLAGWSIFVLLVGIYIAVKLDLGSYTGIFKLITYGFVCLGWLITLGWAFRFRNRRVDPFSQAAFVTGFGLLTFVVLPPDHLTNSNIIRTLFLRAEREMSFSPAYIAELTALHVLTIFFKSTPVFGFALLAGTAISLAYWRMRELMLPLLVALSYFGGLLLLPLGQTFYTIPILPILSLLVAHSFLRLWGVRRGIALMVAALAISWWGVEIIQCFPDYHLNGYQWVGERVLFGRSSIGYASVVYTPEDGVQQAMEWLNDKARPGQVAQLYFNEWHVVRHMAPEPLYQLRNGFEESLSSHPDYVLIHINALHAQGFGKDTPEGDINRYPFDYDIFKQLYKQVFVVQRAFGLEVASVWQRK